MSTAQDETAIRAQMGIYLKAYEKHDAADCAAIYAENALVLTPWGPPAKSRSAIEETHREWFEEGETNKSLTITDLRVNGDLATCLMGFSADVPADGGGTEPSHGSSLSALARNTDGIWLIQQQMLLGLDTPLTETFS